MASVKIRDVTASAPTAADVHPGHRRGAIETIMLFLAPVVVSCKWQDIKVGLVIHWQEIGTDLTCLLLSDGEGVRTVKQDENLISRFCRARRIISGTLTILAVGERYVESDFISPPRNHSLPQRRGE